MTTSSPQFILDAINAAYMKRQQREASMPLRPSALGDCALKNALLFDQVPTEPRTPESMRVMERGTQRDEALSRALKEGIDSPVLTQQKLWIPLAGIEGQEAQDVVYRLGVPDRVQLREGVLWFSGSADAILVALGPDGEDWLVDWKTAGAYGFTRQTGEDGPDPGYIAQLDSYALGWETISGQRPRVALIYECQDSDARKGIRGGQLEVVELEPEYAQHEGSRARAQMVEVLRAWLAGDVRSITPSVPPPSPQAGNLDWKCNYCSIGPVACGGWGEVENAGTTERPKWRTVE